VTAAKPEQDQMLYGCAPWNLRSTCYSCASADVIESAGARPAQVDTTFLLENAPADDDLA
jgi:hypothetical protein